MTVHSVDNLIAQDMANAQAPVQAIQNPAPAAPEAPAPVDSATEAAPSASDSVTNSAQPETVPDLAQNTPTEIPQKTADSSASPIDEYGNPVEKEKTYTEKEVQRMIQERLSRTKAPEQAHQPAQPQQQQAPQEGEEGWEAQLEGFVDKVVDKREQKKQEREWKAQEAARQAEFEAKFSTGMNKYQDFQQVVSGKPITDAMMRGTMTLENPAAFIYAASKLHPQELARISQLADPVMQAAEVGRLHERMVKTRNGATSAPRPLEPAKGDITPRPVNHRPNIDQLILQHAKSKQARRSFARAWQMF